MDSKRYDALHGIHNWAGLLEPLDLDLRKLLLGYGDLALAAELAINVEKDSKYCGFSHYGKSSFFKGLMLPWADSKYNVTSFIYGTCHINSKFLTIPGVVSRTGNTTFESNWNGFVAVSNDEFTRCIGRREIVVVWRGTATTFEWVEDFGESSPVSAEPLLPVSKVTGGATETPQPQVQEGLHTIYNTSNPSSEFVKASARTQLLLAIQELLIKYKDEKVSITCTGHSLGGCLSVLSAADLAANVVPRDINVSAFIFECPQVGNKAFKEKLDELHNLKILRVLNEPDSIPLWPSKALKSAEGKLDMESTTNLLQYVDVGVELLIDSRKSLYLKSEENDYAEYHSLPVVLHTLSGWNGKNGEFNWRILKRSLGAVNIQGGFLKEEYKIPAAWWGAVNKGMVLNDDGDWVLAPIDPKDNDIPSV